MQMTKRPMKAEDLFQFNWVSDPSVSATGDLVFVKTSISEKTKKYQTQLHLLPAGQKECFQFAAGENDKNPIWSPDGSRLAFLRSKDGIRQLWLLPRNGGEAQQATALKRHVGAFSWSPDGTSIAFVSKVSASPEQDDRSIEEEKQYFSEHVRVVNRIKSKADGEGHWDDRRSQLFLLALETGVVTQLTAGNYDVMEPFWSPDSQTISFIAKITEESGQKEAGSDSDLVFYSDIYSVTRSGGELKKITHSNLSISQASYSPNGDIIAFFGNDRSFLNATQTRLYAIPSNGGEVYWISEWLDAQLGDSGINDMRAHQHTPSPLFSRDGSSIYSLVTTAGNVQVYRFGLDGSHQALTEGQRQIYQFALAPSEDFLILASTQVDCPGELYRLDLSTGTETRLTGVNDAFFASVEVSLPEEFWYQTSDGWDIQGWLMRPIGFEAGKQYPAVLEIHGGPHGMYSHSFFQEFQLLAAAGYAVIYCNPRGGHGYSQKFVDACRGDYGGRDYQDLMEFTDYALQKFPFLDGERLGVTGGSYGGFMTNWIVGHTDRFKAAVTQRSISNWLSFYGVSDIGYYFTEWQINGNPWDDAETLWKHSPLAYVHQIETPLLILHGEQDLRCPIEQGEQLFVALKRLQKKTELVRFPGANHDLSRNGDPSLRVERLNRIVNWFVDHVDRTPSVLVEKVNAN